MSEVKSQEGNPTEIKSFWIFIEMANNEPYAKNEPNNHCVTNSAPKTFAGSNEPSSFSQTPLPT